MDHMTTFSSVDLVGSFRRMTLADFREEKTDALEYKKLRMIFVAEHKGAITVSKLSDCSIGICVLSCSAQELACRRSAENCRQ
jgi:hypothetical protein